MNVDLYFLQYTKYTYGLDNLASKYFEIYMYSIDCHRKADIRIELFRKFIGFDMERLPYSIFEKFV